MGSYWAGIGIEPQQTVPYPGCYEQTISHGYPHDQSRIPASKIKAQIQNHFPFEMLQRW